MGKTTTCLVAALLMSAFGQPRVSAQKTESLPISLCSVVATPEQFDGKQITIKARYESDGMHASILTDNNCSRGIGLSAPHDFRGEKTFEKAIDTGRPGTLDKLITGIFVGTFKYQPGRIPAAILKLKEVRDVSVTLK